MQIIPALIILCFGSEVIAQPIANFSGSPTSGCVPLVVNFTDLSTGNPTGWRWDLGNGTTSVLQNPSATYFIAGQYNIKLVVRNSAGSDSLTRLQYITVNAIPVVDFIGTPLTGCFPLVVQFTDLSTAGAGSIDTRQWDFGDGNTSTAQNPQHTYTSAGNYNVSLRIKNTAGCIKSFTKLNYVFINTGVHADFNQIVQTSCNPPVTVNFQNLSTGIGLLSYQWNFGDGGTSTALNPSHTYVAAGTYTVRLIVTNLAGCRDTLTRINTITIGSVSPNFSMPDSICIGIQVPLSNTSVPVPSSNLWKFGDGTTSTDFNPLKVYSSAGTYTVKLVDNFGACSDSISKTLIVLPKPTLSFIGDHINACKAPLTVNFTSSIIGATSFFWTFGDGSTSTSPNPTHTYNSLGSYDVTLIASNSVGCTDTLFRPYYINIAPPEVNFINIPIKGCAPLTHTLSPNIISVDPIVSFQWDFGDGTTSTLPNPSHTWVNPGNYTILLIITTAGGCTDTTNLIDGVRVGVKPVPNFVANPLEACASTQILFTDLSTGNPDQWLWIFGDGEMSADQNPNHLYADTGTFTVTLIAWNNGCADTITFTNYIHIKPPIADFFASYNCSHPYDRQFLDRSIGADTWLWDFGDGATSNLRNPTHTYAVRGVYTVSLTVSNFSTGCSYTKTNEVDVIIERADFIADDSDICLGSLASFHARNMNVANIRFYRWNFGDGTIITDSTGSEIHQYLTTGRFTVSLVIYNMLGCTDTLIKQLYVHVGKPTASFRAATIGTCINTPVNFIDSSHTDGVHPIVSWIWYYGDGTIDALTAPPFRHAYSAAGIYSVTLVVNDNHGCTDTSTRLNYINVSQSIALFTSDDTVSCPNKPVSFLSYSTGPNLSYNWNFGDGTTSTLSNPIHQYSADGLYTIRLYIIDQYGCTDSMTRQSYIRIVSPHAQFSMSDSVSTCPPLIVDFSNHSTNFISQLWDFGDGTTSSLDSPSHFYSNTGIYNVRLTITSRGGCTDQKIKQVVVNGPVGSFAYNNITGCAPLQVNFQAHTPDLLTFIWDFNDGTTIRTPDSVISHVYITPGAYLPKLILVDPNGCQVPIEGLDSINVYGVLAKYNIVNGTVCDSGYVQFINNSIVIGAIQSYFWSFGDGTTSMSPSPATHYYNTTGLYNTFLIVTTQSGCRDTAHNPIPVRIVATPKTGIGGDSAACVPATLQFLGQIAVPDTSAISWKWTFGNGNISNLQNPVPQVYPVPGFYNIRSIATNSSGCSDTTNKVIQVYPLPNVQTGPDTWICRGQSLSITTSGASGYNWTPVTGLSCTNCANPNASPDSSIRYVVSGTSSFGCVSTDTLAITVQQRFPMTIGPPDTICIGKNVGLSANGADQYSWFPTLGLSDPTIRNPVAAPAQSTNYQVIGSDMHACFKDTGYIFVSVYPMPLVDAGTDRTINVGQSINIIPVISSDVTSAAWSPSTGIVSYNFPGITARPTVTTEYNIEVSNKGHCIARDKITIYVVCNDANVFIPNTFSPNGDGVNDVFYIRGSGVFRIKMLRIFNRWGEVVFEGSNINPNDASAGWNGTFKGKKLTPDVFVYTADVLCANDTILTYKGNVTLIQ